MVDQTPPRSAARAISPKSFSKGMSIKERLRVMRQQQKVKNIEDSIEETIEVELEVSKIGALRDRDRDR